MKLPWQIVEPLHARQFAEIRRAVIFECCKWDPQVEDVCTLSPVPLVLTSEAWAELVGLAEKLARETIQAEHEILQKPRCWPELGLPWTFRRKLRQPGVAEGQSHHLRLIRFDFHFTSEGWRISEANSDVPGGFNEASGFTRLIARQYGGLSTPGDPSREIALAARNATGIGRTVALIHATAFTDDRQVMIYLARELGSVGLNAVLAGPDQLRWENGRSFLTTEWFQGPVDFVFRFFPTEWLPALPRRCALWRWLGGSRTLLCNPASAIISQSKRFPLVWDELSLDLPTWRSLLPPTHDPRRANLEADKRVLKPVFGRVGDLNGAAGPSAIVNVDPIVGALQDEAQALAELRLAPNASPVFLLDSNRSADGGTASPGRFDNRWAVFPQDFPSASFLRSNGVRSMVLAQGCAGEPQRDLAHVLLRWQLAGLEILAADVRSAVAPGPIRISRPGQFRMLWYRALVLAGLRRNCAGGFGGVVPEPIQSSGFG